MKVGFLMKGRGSAHLPKTEHIWVLRDHPNVWTYASACGIVVSRVDIVNFRNFRFSLWDAGQGFSQCKRCAAWRRKHGDAQVAAETLGGIDLSAIRVPDASRQG